MRIYAGNFPTITGFFFFSFAFHFQVKRSKTRLNAHICLFLLFFSLRFFVLQTFSYGKYYFGVKADSKLFRFFDCYANSHLENLQPNGKQNKTKSNEQIFKWISIDLCTTQARLGVIFKQSYHIQRTLHLVDYWDFFTQILSTFFLFIRSSDEEIDLVQLLILFTIIHNSNSTQHFLI